MNEIISLSELLDFAMRRSETSLRFYDLAARRYFNGSQSRFFEMLSTEESDHLSALLMLRRSVEHLYEVEILPREKVAPFLVDLKPRDRMDFVQALFWSIVRAETSVKLYMTTARLVNSVELRNRLLILAASEIDLKRRLEEQYDAYLESDSSDRDAKSEQDLHETGATEGRTSVESR